MQESLSKQESSIDAIRKKFDTEKAETQERHQTALKESQNIIVALQNQKKQMESGLKHPPPTDKISPQDIEARFTLEKKALLDVISELKAVKQQYETQLQRIRQDNEEDREKLESGLRAEIGDLQRRLKQSETALMESEANTRRIEIKKTQELELHKRQTVTKFNELSRRADIAANARTQTEIDTSALEPPASRSSQPASTQELGISQVMGSSSEVLQNFQGAKPKKKVNRQDNSVLSVDDLSHYQRDSLVTPTQREHREESPDYFSGVNPFFNDDLGAREQLDENGVSLLGFSGEIVTETQQESGPKMNFEQFNQSLQVVPATQQDLGPSVDFEQLNLSLHQEGKQVKSSSALSSCASDIIEKLGEERMVTPIGPMRFGEHQRPKESPAYSSSFETPIRVAQANTASRMAPSTGQPKASQTCTSRGNQSSSYDNASPECTSTQLHQIQSRISSEARPRDASSPDFVHQPSPGSRVTYGHSFGKPTPSNASPADSIFRAPEKPSRHKRKSTGTHGERDISSKRVRDLPQSIASSLPTRHAPQGTGSSSVAYHSQSQMRSSPQGMASGSSYRSTRSSRIKTSGTRYETRFSRELGGR
ncbi:uncharacterized protein BDR25DRAFT_15851 [Lindgomyces ingoldianus]|uniref:Uncharacterized protein n=1 Tax=Lindgomyces ingoldianus TaxID=673940 RepID=A0ACB6R2Q3_9PLEO|nr:uncharacterized protein BDR25DRAFT_15851 [Lindgomyces ingoldianus]KAF2472610.1 hypothetical protein BDR25DRAFT_15851 [Lindgomyces ingoldianus]